MKNLQKGLIIAVSLSLIVIFIIISINFRNEYNKELPPNPYSDYWLTHTWYQYGNGYKYTRYQIYLYDYYGNVVLPDHNFYELHQLIIISGEYPYSLIYDGSYQEGI
jgi:hypothetical protein